MKALSGGEFQRRCAYCGAEGDLVMDHAVPINRTSLGEHRLGNLVPACPASNSRKGDQHYSEFLEGQPNTIRTIGTHMDRYGYVPLGDNEQIRMIIDIAHKEPLGIAERYIKIINGLLRGRSGEA
jgi:hypothetical protein